MPQRATEFTESHRDTNSTLFYIHQVISKNSVVLGFSVALCGHYL